MVSIIAAKSKNNALGKENKLLWHLPIDFKFFKDTTLGHPIIMGRKTFESLPKALPGRTNIIITGDRNYKKEDAMVTHSLEDAIKLGLSENEEVFICGGGQIYEEALDKNLVNKMYITEVDVELNGDTFFPTFDESKWDLIKKNATQKTKGMISTFVF